MKEVIFELPEIDYALIHWPDNTYTPWVAAWHLNKKEMYWGQGHYFCTKKGAVEYLIETLRERYPVYFETKINELCDQLQRLVA